jgi:hypothetical protein
MSFNFRPFLDDEPIAIRRHVGEVRGYDPGPRDPMEEKREHDTREDTIKWEREVKAQRAWCRFCYQVWTIQFPDALKEKK